MLDRLAERAGAAKSALMFLVAFLGAMAQDGFESAQNKLPGDPTRTPSRGQLGIFMVLVFGSVALVVVSIVLLFGQDIAGEFAQGIDNTGEYSDAANSTVNSTGDAFELFGTSVLVVPAAAVLAVLIGGLIGAVTMVGSGGLPGMGMRGGNGGR